MPLQPKFNRFTTATPVLTSYNYSDIESGLGYTDYYAMVTDLSGGAEYILSDRVEYSTLIATKRVGAGTSTLTFNSSVFNKSKTVRGTAIFSCGIAGTAGYANATARLAKVSGVTVTYLSSEITGATITTNSDGGKMVLLKLPLTETFIAEGEYLRLIVKLVTTVNAGVAVEIGHDPKGRDGTILGLDPEAVTITKISVPYKLYL